MTLTPCLLGALQSRLMARNSKKLRFLDKFPCFSGEKILGGFGALAIRTMTLTCHFFCYLLQGDSGGPLVCPYEDDWIQVGIASFTSANRPGQVPGAFTRVSSYIDWMSDTIKANPVPAKAGNNGK